MSENTAETAVFEKKARFYRKRTVLVPLALVCCFLWGSAFPCIKIGYSWLQIDSADTATQILFAGVRFTLAGIMAIVIASFQEKKVVLPTMDSLPRIGVLALFQTILQYIFYYIGLANTTGVKGAILHGTTTFFCFLLAAFLFRMEKMSAPKLTGCILGFIGLVLVNLSGGGLNFDFRLVGEGFMLLAAVSSAMSANVTRIFTQKDSPVMLNGYQFLFGGIFLCAVGLLMGGTLTFYGIKCVLLVLYMAFVSAVAYSLWGTLLKYNPVSRVTIFGFLFNVLGVLMSAVLLQEYSSLNIRCLIALVLVSAGIIIVNRGDADSAEAQAG